MARPKKYHHGYASSTSLPDLIDKPGLRYWYGAKGTQECEKVKKKSQQIGREVHEAIEQFLRGKPFKECYEYLDEGQSTMLSQLIEWCNKTKLKPIEMEQPLYWYCEEHHPEPHKKDCEQDCPDDCTCFTLAGTPDVICTFNGGKTLNVLDWKTDAVPKNTAEERERAIKYYWQNSSYAMMYNRKYGTKINKALTVRSVTSEKVKPDTQNKSKLILPSYVKVEYSEDLTFATYKFNDLQQGFKDVRTLRHIYRQVKGK